MMITVSWDAMASDLVGVYRRYDGKCCFHLQGFSIFFSLRGRKVLFDPEDDVRVFLRIADKYLPDYTASHHRRQ
jgi:hypothetical protein